MTFKDFLQIFKDWIVAEHGKPNGVTEHKNPEHVNLHEVTKHEKPEHGNHNGIIKHGNSNGATEHDNPTELMRVLALDLMTKSNINSNRKNKSFIEEVHNKDSNTKNAPNILEELNITPQKKSNIPALSKLDVC